MLTLVVGDGDVDGATSSLLSSCDIDDAVGVDVKGHINLGRTTRSRRDAGQFELVQQVVVFGHDPLTLVHLDKYNCLVVRDSGPRQMVVLRLMKAVITPPTVSIPTDIGMTSISRRSWTIFDLSPCNMAAWTDAP